MTSPQFAVVEVCDWTYNFAVSDAILLSEGREANVPEKILRAYNGRYRSTDPEHPQFLVVTYADGHLYVQNEGAKNEPARRHAETPSKFYLTNQEVELSFDLRVAGSLQIFDFTATSVATFMQVLESERRFRSWVQQRRRAYPLTSIVKDLDWSPLTLGIVAGVDSRLMPHR